MSVIVNFLLQAVFLPKINGLYEVKKTGILAKNAIR